MTIRKTHFSIRGDAPICGANQNRKIGRRVLVTGAIDRVTCEACAKRMHGVKAFAESLSNKLGIVTGGR